MSKQNKQSMQEKLQSRTPATMWQVINPVDMLGNEAKRPKERMNK
jgi:hypothetical protein